MSPTFGLGRLLTLRRQEVGEQHQARDEHAGHDDVNDVEERLPADDEPVYDVKVPATVSGVPVLAADLPGAEVDGPLAVLCRTGDALSLLWAAGRTGVGAAGGLDCLGLGPPACGPLGQGRKRIPGAVGNDREEVGLVRPSRIISGKGQIKARWQSRSLGLVVWGSPTLQVPSLDPSGSGF